MTLIQSKKLLRLNKQFRSVKFTSDVDMVKVFVYKQTKSTVAYISFTHSYILTESRSHSIFQILYEVLEKSVNLIHI